MQKHCRASFAFALLLIPISITLQSCASSRIPASLQGTWLPQSGSDSSWGFTIEFDGQGTFTSKEILGKYKHYKRAFRVEVSDQELRIRQADEEGNYGGASSCTYVLQGNQLTLSKPPSPLVDGVFVKSGKERTEE